MTDLDDLEAKARAATPGPWEWEPPSGGSWPQADESLVSSWKEPDGYPATVVSGWGYDASGTEAKPEDREFIAAANPETVLALVERVRRAEAALRATDDHRIADWQKLEAERDEAVSKALVWAKSCADANKRAERTEAQIHDDGGFIDQLVNMQERAERAEAVIAEALAAYEHWNWNDFPTKTDEEHFIGVKRILATYQNGDNR